MLARAGVDLHSIKLLGRWGSDAIELYVQDAALCRQTLLASQTISGLQVAEIRQPVTSASSSSTMAPDIIPKNMLLPADSMMRLQEQMRKLKQAIQRIDPLANMFILNLTENRVHLKAGQEHSVPPVAWHTKCGWKYAFANFKRCNTINPAFLICSKCSVQSHNNIPSSSSDSV